MILKKYFLGSKISWNFRRKWHLKSNFFFSGRISSRWAVEEVCSDEERSACIARNMLPTRVGSVWKSFRYHIESLGTISDPIIKDFVKELLFVCSPTHAYFENWMQWWTNRSLTHDLVFAKKNTFGVVFLHFLQKMLPKKSIKISPPQPRNMCGRGRAESKIARPTTLGSGEYARKRC